MQKKLSRIVLAALLVLGLAACGQTSEPAESVEETPAEEVAIEEPADGAAETTENVLGYPRSATFGHLVFNGENTSYIVDTDEETLEPLANTGIGTFGEDLLPVAFIYAD